MLYRSAEKPLCGLGWRSVRCWFRHRDGGNYRTCLPRVNSRNCRSERPVDHDHRNDAEHCHAEEHSQGQVLHAALADPGWREAALAVRTPAITGRARRNRATSAASVPFKRSGSWQPKMPCSLGTGPLSGHPLNERTATEALKRKGMATKMTMSRATSIPYRWGCRPRAEGPDSGRPFTTVVAFAIAPPLCRWPEYSSTRCLLYTSPSP